MPPDPNPLDVLRARLAAALATRSATLEDAPAEHLTRYAHELAFGPDASQGRDGVEAVGWVALAPGRALRRYLAAMVHIGDTTAWFPGLLKRAAMWRSHLGADEQADLAILLVADQEHGQVSVLERNEAFAQVLVWVPGPDAPAWPGEADRFVARLRLAPIIAEPTRADGDDLSPIDAIFDGVSGELRELWRGVLMDPALKDAERAARLLAAVDPNDGGADA